MDEATGDKLQVAYDGRALRRGRMPMLPLGTSIRAQALLIHRVKDLLYGESVSLEVDVDEEFESGSFAVPVHILSDAATAAKHVLAGETFTALANLLQLLGFAGISGTTIYQLFKRNKGRRIEGPDDVPKNLKIDISVELLVRIYNDPEVQAQLRKVLEPLRHGGIDEFQKRRQGRVIERVFKRDLQAADEAEVEALTKNEEILLDIEKSAWRRNLAWHFSDGRTSFDARIEDENFWKRIEHGEAFADGDRLRVHLNTTARRTPNGTLHIERVIPTVIEVEHVTRPRMLFNDE